MSNLFAYLSYRDVDAAITWLEALGFEPTTRLRDEGNVTVHAELRLGDAVVMVASADEPYQTPELIGPSTGYGLPANSPPIQSSACAERYDEVGVFLWASSPPLQSGY
jgi:uncharacterized glyoxalase superfamily protein PhnB